MDIKTENQCIKLYSEGNSLRQVAKIADISASLVLKILKKNNAPRRDRVRALILSKVNDFQINPFLHRVINGELLGDGHVTKGVHQSCFSYGTSQEEYANWLSNLFVKNGVPICGNGVYKNVSYYKVRKKVYTKFLFNTLSNKDFYKIRHKWYDDLGVKKVPDNLKISKEVILHWWIGDGSYNKKGKYGWLATDSFLEEEVIILSDKLNSFLNIETRPRSCKIKGEKIVFRIYIPRVSLEEILHFTGFPPVECYRYKWGFKENGNG